MRRNGRGVEIEAKGLDAKRVRKLGSRAGDRRVTRSSDQVERVGLFGILARRMSRREAGCLRSRFLASSHLSCSTPVDRRIKEDAPVETVRDLKRRPRSPRNVYRAAKEKEE